MRPGGGGGGGSLKQQYIFITNISIIHAASAHFKRAQCKLTVSQNLISNDLFGNSTLNKIRYIP